MTVKAKSHPVGRMPENSLVTPYNSPQRPESRTLEQLSIEIENAYSLLKNWRAVADLFEITSGLAYRIARDCYDPRDPVLRTRLGLPALIPTPACTACGQVHTLGEICPQLTPVKVIAYQITAEERAALGAAGQAVLPAPVVVVKRRLARPGSRRRARVELPADLTPAQRAAVNRLTPAQRLAALLEAAQKEPTK